MALQKDIINEKGVKTDYHRISDYQVDKDNEIIKISIKHYTNESYRDKEKETINFSNTIEEKQKRLTSLMNSNQDGKFTQDIILLTNEINEMYSNGNNFLENSYVYTDIEELPFEIEESYSLENLYNKLSTLEKYKDSTRV